MSEFRIDAGKTTDSEIATEAFTFWGEHELENNEGFPTLNIGKEQDVFKVSKAHAVKISRGNKISYYVKRGKFGRLFNPIGLYSEGKAEKANTRHGQSEWTLKPTSRKIFNYYINFLKTKNSAWLNNAEREV